MPPAVPSGAGARSVLSVLWTFAIVVVVVLAAFDFVALALTPGVVVPGIQGIAGGSTTNPGFDVSAAGWSFFGIGSPAAAGVWRASGGNPDGYLETRLLPGTNVVGYWTQTFEVSGSVPFVGELQLDIDVTPGSLTPEVRLHAYVSRIPGIPDASSRIGSAIFAARTVWQSSLEIPADDPFAGPGTFHLTIEVAADSSAAGTATLVGIDNVRLRWATDAAIVFYLFLPGPVILLVSQDATLFLSYLALLLVAVFGSAVYHAVRERKETVAAFTAPLEAIGKRLRTRSAWLAIAQVWLAVTFFQVAVIVLVTALGTEPTSPLQITSRNVWVLLYELLNASVWEELAFRALLMGVPMAVGSLILRVVEVNRSGGAWRGPASPGRHIAGSARYLFGGAVRGTSSREAHVAAWAVLLASSTIFGVAHAPSWGWWKVIPSFVAGLGFGYLFLRHGVTAAILAHFVNDYLSSITWIGVGGEPLAILIALLFFGVAIAGAGFFAWYVLVAWRHLRDLAARLLGRPIPVRRPAHPAGTQGPSPPPSYPNPPPPAWPAPPPPSPPLSSRARDASQLPYGYMPTYVPPPYGYPPVRFQCPACGWVEARYVDGRFLCARCGRVG